MNHPQDSAVTATCDNCSTVLVGGYCHACGQRAHNPLHDLRHAAEEVFESFWHLDGRIFVTVRDLLVPGRVASEFLAGKRTKYIPPLRLFLIMSVLTFFVGKFAVHMDVPISIDEDGQLNSTDMGIGTERIRRAATIDAVLEARTAAQKTIADMRKDAFGETVLETMVPDTERVMHEAARRRMLDLHATPEQLRAAGYDAATPWTPPSTPDSAGEAGASSRKGLFAGWIQHRLDRLQSNVGAMRKDPDTFVRLVLGAVPGALLILMPLFALCLKLLYIRSHRSYLEHLVVAMYSHVAMLGALLLGFLALGLQAASGNGAVTAATATFCVVLFCLVVPAYLLWMQKRVYGQGWLKTLVKYLLLGHVYTMLLTFALLYAVLAGISS